ncbi:MAG: flavodoxin domain-containing protein, partial [Pseudomonadales bacterium]|nr:flavodoxin domain-containing protein [Pseudomonadales bacterium]
MSIAVLKKSPLPGGAPQGLDERLVADLNGLAGKLDQQQLWWASGYLAGVAAAAPVAAGQVAAASQASPAPVWTLFYATETGNSRSIAGELLGQIQALGVEARAVDLADFRPAQLKKESHALFVVATHGLGEPPEGTEAFFEFVLGDRAPRLEHLSYSVLALGDSSYEDFCTAGRQHDDRLQALGASRLAPRVECDVDFESLSEAWQRQMLAHIETQLETQRAGVAAPEEAIGTVAPRLVPINRRQHSRKDPFHAPVLENQPITGRGSSKDVRHLVLSLEGSGLSYLPGDALGVWPTNPPQLVSQFLDLLNLHGDTEVRIDDEATTLESALAHRLELTLLGRSFVQGYADRFDIAPLKNLLSAEDRTAFNDYLADRQIIDVLTDHPQAMSAQELTDTLKRLTPRLYSISSSLEANPDEVHVTIGVVRYTAFEREHLGSTSNYLAEPGETVPVYIAANPRFRLPEDAAAPVVMIGAGTGVAPFRAFLEEREATGADGDNWLFFGDRNFNCDFLYQLEWARFRREGVLTRHDVAFSRDQQAKVYVQDRIRERGADLFDWLERGAHLYLC